MQTVSQRTVFTPLTTTIFCTGEVPLERRRCATVLQDSPVEANLQFAGARDRKPILKTVHRQDWKTGYQQLGFIDAIPRRLTSQC